MKDFEMTEEQHKKIWDACRLTPVILSLNFQQENVKRAWEKLGKELGFSPATVRPNGKGDRFFSAEPIN